MESVIRSFFGAAGDLPEANLNFDVAGNLYGTNLLGGSATCSRSGAGCGVVFKLKPKSDGS